jgi:hypothetical protein
MGANFRWTTTPDRENKMVIDRMVYFIEFTFDYAVIRLPEGLELLLILSGTGKA